MRSVRLIALGLLLTLSGCAPQWTVFGHSMGGPAPAASAPQPAAAVPPAPVAAQSPPVPVAVAQTAGSAPSQSPPVHELATIKAVKVTFTAAAREKIDAEPQFTEGGLVAAIDTEFRAQKLLDESGAGSGDTIKIVIDDFATRSTSNAVIFGYVLSTGTLQGRLEVLTPDGQPLRSAQIRARSRLTRPAGTGHAASFEPLYRGFADLTARNLSGSPEPVGVNH